MESAIAKAEARVAELDSQLNDPKFYAERSKEVSKVIADLEQQRAEVARLYHRWEELEQIRSEQG